MESATLYGFGNALVDIFVEVDQAAFQKLGFDRGTMRLVLQEEQDSLLRSFGGGRAKLVSGGSVANSVIAYSQLGGDAFFSGTVGDDRYGLHYQSEFESLGIGFENGALVGEHTGTSLVFITPDAERTMRTSLGCSGALGPQGFSDLRAKESDILFLEGYLFANPPHTQDLIDRIARATRELNLRLALTLSESWVVSSFRTKIEQILGSVEILFANEEEAKSLTGKSDPFQAFSVLCESIPTVCVTVGPEGVLLQHEGVRSHVYGVKTDPVDLTGAGDMFAGGFLFGITHGYSGEESAGGACYLAHQVIQRVGARLPGDLPGMWKTGIQRSCCENLS